MASSLTQCPACESRPLIEGSSSSPTPMGGVEHPRSFSATAVPATPRGPDPLTSASTSVCGDMNSNQSWSPRNYYLASLRLFIFTTLFEAVNGFIFVPRPLHYLFVVSICYVVTKRLTTVSAQQIFYLSGSLVLAVFLDDILIWPLISYLYGWSFTASITIRVWPVLAYAGCAPLAWVIRCALRREFSNLKSAFNLINPTALRVFCAILLCGLTLCLLIRASMPPYSFGLQHGPEESSGLDANAAYLSGIANAYASSCQPGGYDTDFSSFTDFNEPIPGVSTYVVCNNGDSQGALSQLLIFETNGQRNDALETLSGGGYGWSCFVVGDQWLVTGQSASWSPYGPVTESQDAIANQELLGGTLRGNC